MPPDVSTREKLQNWNMPYENGASLAEKTARPRWVARPLAAGFRGCKAAPSSLREAQRRSNQSLPGTGLLGFARSDKSALSASLGKAGWESIRMTAQC